MKTIIHGTDFTENASRAGRVAAALAARLGDTLLVVHSTEAHLVDAFPYTDQAFERLESAKKAALEKAAEELSQKDLTVRAELAGGLADETIVKIADPSSTRLVVLASLGRRRDGRWKLGSVSERVAEASSTPTLVVRQEEALIGWTQQKRKLRVVCSYDFTASADAALAYLKELRRVGPCDVMVAHVDWPFGEMARLGISGPVALDANHPELQRVLERDLKARVSAILGDMEYSIHVSPGLGRPDFHLIQIAEREQADLIITGTHQRHGISRLWHTSTSRGVLHYAPMSVLVVPAHVEPSLTQIPRIERVLVTTDLSEFGNRAIPHACALLPKGGSLHLLHVVPPRHQTSQKAEDCSPAFADQLKSLVPADANTTGIGIEVEVCEHDSPAEAICQAAERLGADVICLATHGRTGLVSTVMGSTAAAVLAKSKRPLHLVRAIAE